MNKNQWLAKYPDGYTHNIDIPDIPLSDILVNAAKQYSNKTVVHFYDYTLTYKELYQSAIAFAAALQKKGVQKGDRVAVMLPNCPQYVISYFGILLAGGIVTQVNPMLVERELQYLLEDSGSESIILLDGLYPRLKNIQNKTNIKNVITVSLQQEYSPEKPDISFKQFLSNQDPVFTPVNIDPKNDIAVLQYTGGTTGRSKGAMLTHRNLVSNVVQTFEFFKNDFKPGEEICLSVIPFFHVFGMTSCMNLSIYAGNTILLLPPFDIEEVLATIKKVQPTVFPGVPTMYVAITNHPKAEEYGIDSIRTCNSGSAPMPVELLNEFERKTNAKF